MTLLDYIISEVPEEQERLTPRERFERFHDANPQVYRALRRLALGVVDQGQRRFGIAMIYEVLRWRIIMTTTDESEFKLNNDYRAFYARLLMENEPTLEGVFQLRSQSEDS